MHSELKEQLDQYMANPWNPQSHPKPQVVLTAVTENGNALKYAAKELQDDCPLGNMKSWD
jgi:hypothetical protein